MHKVWISKETGMILGVRRDNKALVTNEETVVVGVDNFDFRNNYAEQDEKGIWKFIRKEFTPPPPIENNEMIGDPAVQPEPIAEPKEVIPVEPNTELEENEEAPIQPEAPGDE